MFGGQSDYINNLVTDAKEGDSNSFGVIFAFTYEDIHKHCKKYLSREYDIQDVMLNTYCSAYKRLDQLGNAKNIEKWLFLICEGHITTFLKKQGLTREEAKKIVKESRKSGKKADMTLNNAEQILESVLILVGADTNTLPLEALISYHQYRNNRLMFQRALLLIALLGLVLIPFFTLSPSMDVTLVPGSYNGDFEKFSINVKTIVPVDYVEGTLDNDKVTIMLENDKMYTAYITGNGTFTVTTTLLNRKSVTKTIEINDFDVTPPMVTSYYLDNGDLIVITSDDRSGVDFEKTVVTQLSTGKEFGPIEYNEGTGLMRFPYIQADSALTVVDKEGNQKSYTID